MNIGIFSYAGKQQELESLFVTTNHKIFWIDENKDFSQNVDLIVSYGGDGTFLKAAQYAFSKNVLLHGVFAGRFGFLCVGEKEKLHRDLLCIEKKTVAIEKRTVLEVLHQKKYFAMNEIVISADKPVKMVALSVSIDGVFVGEYLCDGIVISTAAGSTGYNYSCSGPLVNSAEESVVITPISPHQGISRSIVLSRRSIIQVRSLQKEMRITFDGEKHFLHSDVEVRLSEKKLSVFTPPEYNFWERVRRKFF